MVRRTVPHQPEHINVLMDYVEGSTQEPVVTEALYLIDNCPECRRLYEQCQRLDAALEAKGDLSRSLEEAPEEGSRAGRHTAAVMETAAGGGPSVRAWRNLALVLVGVVLLTAAWGAQQWVGWRRAAAREQAYALKLRVEQAGQRSPDPSAGEKPLDDLRREVQDQAARAQKQKEEIDQLRQALEEYKKPRANAVLLMTFYQTRELDEVQTIVWPRSKPYLSGSLPEVEDLDYKTYQVVLADARGRVVWQADGVRKDEAGQVRLLLNRAEVPDGEYRLTLYGVAGGQQHEIARHRFRVRSRS
jgi:hypothetical protein